MAFKVYVDGQEGTTGLRLLDYLAARDDIELLRIDAELGDSSRYPGRSALSTS